MVRARDRGGSFPRTTSRSRRKKEIGRGGARGPRGAPGVCKVPGIGRGQGAACRGCGTFGNRVANGAIPASFLSPRFWGRNCACPSGGDFAGNRGIAIRGGREVSTGFVGQARVRRIRANPRSARSCAAGR